MEKITMEEALAGAAREIASEKLGPQAFAVTIIQKYLSNGEVVSVDRREVIELERTSRGVVFTAPDDYVNGSRYDGPDSYPCCLDGAVLRHDGLLDVPRLAVYVDRWLSDPPGPECGIGDYMRVRQALPYLFECEDDVREGISKVLDFEIPENRFWFPELFARNRWRGYPEAFYKAIERLRPGSDAEAEGMGEALAKLPRDDGMGAAAVFAELVMRGGRLEKCKSVRRALVRHLDVAAAMVGSVAFSELTDPNVFCSFVDSPRALPALAALRKVDGDGQVLSCLVDVFGEKEALGALTDDAVIEALDRKGYLLTEEDSPDVWLALDGLSRSGVNARQALIALPEACEDPYEYTGLQLSLECDIDSFSFRLPRGPNEMVRLGQELHNCLATYASAQPEDRTVLYVTEDPNSADKPIAALEVSVGKGADPRIVQARMSCNADIPKGSRLKGAVDRFRYVMWDAVVREDAASHDESFESEMDPDSWAMLEDIARDLEEAMMSIREVEVGEAA